MPIIISDPKVFLLDEATSALDPRAETVVQHAPQTVSQGRTVLVIAHKLATTNDADNIAVIANGYVVEHGTHEQLIEQGGPYAALVHTQGLGHGDQRGGNASKVNDETELNGGSLKQMESSKKTESIGRSTRMTPKTKVFLKEQLDFPCSVASIIF
ncbi:MAG: hypothetical protein Q9188_005136 [Gyalolechia gomerana]